MANHQIAEDNLANLVEEVLNLNIKVDEEKIEQNQGFIKDANGVRIIL